MIRIPSHPDYSKNQEKCRGDEYPCVVCGLPCKNPQWRVHVHDGGLMIVTEEEAATLDDRGELGWQPIGSNCLKKHPELKPYAVRQTGGK